MKLMDPHIHMTSRTTDDYERMRAAGIQVVVEPSFWLGQQRTHVGSFEDYFLSLVGWERFRARQFGIHHYCTIALNPKEANDPYLLAGVLELLPRYLEKESVVAVGEIGFDDQTEREEKAFLMQLELAMKHQLPVLVHTPHRDKKSGTLKCLEVVKESGINPELVLIDHNTEETLRSVLDFGAYAGHSIYPHTKMDEVRMVKLIREFGTERIIVNSAADWGVSDPLMVPKTARLMEKQGFSTQDIEKVFWHNPVGFFAQSGRLDLELIEMPATIDQRELYAGNSVLRGQEAKTDVL